MSKVNENKITFYLEIPYYSIILIRLVDIDYRNVTNSHRFF